MTRQKSHLLFSKVARNPFGTMTWVGVFFAITGNTLFVISPWAAKASSAPSGVTANSSGAQGNANATSSAGNGANNPEFQGRLRTALEGKQPVPEIERVVAELEVMLTRKPGYAPYLEALGILQQRLERYDASRQALQNLKTPSLEAMRSLALSHFALGEYRKAALVFARLGDLSATPGDWEKYCQALQQSGRKVEAVKQWEGYRARYPKSEAGVEFLADAYRQPLNKEKLLPLLELQLARKGGTAEEAALLQELAGLYGPTHARSIELRERYLKLAPEDPEALKGLGRSYEERGEKQKALAAYEKAATFFGADGAFLARFARLQASVDPAKALPWFERACALLPNDVDLAVEHAEVLQRLGKSEEALAAYGEALRLNPHHEKARAGVLSLAEKSKTEGAWMDALITSERKNPKDHALQFRIARLFLSKGQKPDAYRYLAKAIANAPKQADYLALLPATVFEEAQILRHFPALQDLQKQGNSDPDLLILLGRGYSLYKNPTRANEIWEQVWQRSPDKLKGRRGPILDAATVKNYTLIVAMGDVYLKEKPNDIEVRRVYAKALVETGASEAKIRDCLTQLVPQDPESADWGFRLAELDTRARDTVAALSHMQIWVRAHPDDKKGYQFIQTLAKGRKGAETQYLDALDILSRMDGSHSGNYELEMAYHWYDQGDWARAVEALARLTSNFPDDAQMWNRYGQAELKVGRDGAEKALEKAHRLEPGRFEYARDFAATLKNEADLKSNLATLRMVRAKQNDLETRMRYAKSLYLNGETGASAVEWDGILKENANLGYTDTLAALSYIKTGQAAKARPLLEKQLERNPRDIGLMTTLADLYAKEGKGDKRAAMMERIVQEDFTEGDWELKLARDKEKSDVNEALRHYSRWVTRNPEDLNALKAYHRLATQNKDTTSLIEALRLLGKIKEADDNYRYQLAEIFYTRSGETENIEVLVKAHPDWRQGRLLLIHEYHGKNDWKNLGRFENALQQEAAADGQWLEALGDLRAQQGRHEEAAKAYFDWLVLKKQDRSVFDKVVRYVREQKSTYLTPVLRIGSDAFPKDLDLKRELAKSLGKSNQALDVWSALAQKQTDNVEVVAAAAEMALSVGRTDEAIRQFSQWGKIAPKEERPWRALAELYTQKGDRPKLAETLEALCALVPGDKALLLRLAELETGLNQTDKAVDAYRTALYLDPKDKVIRDRLMGVLRQKGGKEITAEVLTEIQSLDSSAHEAQYELAKILLQQGKKEKAFAFLSSALDKSPKNQVYQALLPRTIHSREQMQKYFPLLEELSLRSSVSKTDRNNFDLFFWLGRGYAMQEKWDKSGVAFGIAWRLNASAFGTDRDAVLAVYRAKDFALAAELADKYLANNPGFDSEVQQVQILAYEKTKRSDAQIRTALQNLLLFDKENSGALLRLSELDLRVGDTLTSIANIRQCLTTNPNEVRAYKMLLPLVTGKPQHKVTYVVVLEKLSQLDSTKRGDYRLKLADFYQERKNYKETSRLLSLVVVDKPGDAQAWYRLGQCRNQLEVGDLGVTAFRHAWELVPENLTFARTFAQTLHTPDDIKQHLKLFQFLDARGPVVEERRQLSLSYYYNGDLAGAARSFDKLLVEKGELERKQPEASLVYLRTQQPAKALPLYAFRWDRDSTNMPYLDTLVGLYTVVGQEPGRVRTLEAIVGLDPEHKDYQLDLARAYEKQGKGLAALPHYGQWTARHPKELVPLKAFHKLAEAAKDTASLESALRLITRIAGVEPTYHFQLAVLDFKFTGQVEPVEKLVKAYPQWREGRMLLAREYYRRDQVSKLAAFEKDLAEEVKRDPFWLEPLGDWYAYANKKNEANATYFTLLQRRSEASKTSATANLESQQNGLRSAFDKAWLYGESSNNPNRRAVLAIGHSAFPKDISVTAAYASALGPTGEALRLYQELLAQNPNDLTSLKGGTAAALAVNDYAVTRDLAQRWAEAEPQTAPPLQALITATEKLGDLKARVAAMERLLEITSTDHALCFKLGQATLKLGNREKALEYLVRADEMKPKDPVYSAELIATLDAEGKEGLRLGKMDQALEAFGMLLVKQPQHKQAALYVGLAQAEAGDFNAAEPLLAKGLDQSAEPKPILAKAWRLFGEGFALSNRLPKALEAFKRSLSIDPTDRKSAQDRLDAVMAMNNKAELPSAYVDMLRIDSNHVDAARGLAEIRMRAGNFAEAVALYRRVVSQNDQDLAAWCELGEALRSLKRPAEAREAFEKAYGLGDRSNRIVGGLVRLHHDLGTLGKNIELLESWVAQAPEDDEAAAWAAELALSRGDLARAEELYSQAAQSSPDALSYQEGLADVFLKRNDAESALETLQPRVAKLSANGRIIYADALNLNGRFEDAESVYRKALQTQPTARAAAGLTSILLEKRKPQEARKIWQTYGLENKPEAATSKVRIQLALRERDEALAGAKALVAQEASATHFLLLASVQLDRHDHLAALSSVASARAINTDLEDANYIAGLAQIEKGDLEAARREFLVLQQAGPRHSRSLGLRGLSACARSEHNLAEAREHLLAAAELYPSPAVLAELSTVALQLGNLDEAEEYAQKSLELADDFPDGAVALAETMLQRQKPQEAKDYIREALDKNAYACELHNERAKIELVLGNFDNLAASSKQALALCPDQAMPWYYAGVAADKAYQRKQAEAHFAQYRKLGGDGTTIPQGY